MSCKMANIHHGVSLTIKFHKVWLLDVCFFYLYKRSNWKYSIKPKTSCRWQFPFFMIINDPNATAKQLCENLDKTQEGASQRKWFAILTHLNKHSKLFLHVSSKRLYIHQFSLITNQFNKVYWKSTWDLY